MKLKNMVSVGLSAVLSLSVLAACSKDEGSSAASPSPAAVSAEPSGTLASDKPIDLSVHMLIGGISFNQEWPVFKKAAEKTNVSLKGTISKNVTNSNEAFNLMMASRDLAQVVATTKDNFFKFGAEGAFIPLDKLIDEHAPHIKEFFENYPEVARNAKGPDGNTYYIPFTPDGEPATGWFIRQDWLDKLGLQVPKTVDEYYNVLKAFKEKDPNGNGKADEVPYFNGASTYGIYFLLSLWDAGTDFAVRDNKVIFEPLRPEYKVGMTNLAQWYKEGLVDQEIFTRGAKAREILLGDNVGGSTHDWFGSTAGYNTSLKDKIPGIKFYPIAPPADSKGVVVEYDFRSIVRNNGWGISSSNKNPVETIKYFDYFFTEEGRTLMNFGLEGETYTLVNGKPTFTKELLSQANVNQTLKEKYGAQMEIGFQQDFEYEKQWMHEIALAGAKEYIDKGYINKKVRLPNLTFTPEEQLRVTALLGPITTFRQESGQRWVMGAESVEAGYDNFIKKLKDMNVDELLTIYNTAYQRYVKQ